MAKKYPALSEEAQLRVEPQFEKLWGSLTNSSPMLQDRFVGLIILGTLIGGAENFSYLPGEERVKIFTLADRAMRWGYLLGRAPEEAADILHSVRPLCVEVEPPEWFKPLLGEYRQR